MSEKKLNLILDVEGTLVTDQFDKSPRPGLFDFLEFCKKHFRLYVMTAMYENNFRDLAIELVASGAAPEWLPELEYVSWVKAGAKDITLIGKHENTFIVDDMEHNILKEQKYHWLQITRFDKDNFDHTDKELAKIQSKLEAIMETQDILDDPEMMKQLKGSEKDVKDGRFVPEDDAFG